MNQDSGDHIDPSSAASKEDLARFMRMLRARADSPSYRDLEKRAILLGRGRSLPRTTMGEVLAGRRFPSKAFLLTFVELCGANPGADHSWESAWNRLAVRYKVDTPSEQDATGQADTRLEQTRQELRAARLRVRELEEQLAGLRSGLGQQAATWTEVAEELEQRGERRLAEKAAAVVGGLRSLLPDTGEPPAREERYGRAASAPPEDRLPAHTPRPAPTEAGAETGTAATAPTGTGTDITTIHPQPPTGRVSGSLPAVWNVEPRNPEFTGRDAVLADLRRRLHARNAGAVQALRGVGGVGKTQIAIEYACRFAADYDVVWWIAAEDPALIGEQVAGLAAELSLTEPGTDTATAVAVLKSCLRGRDRWLLIFDNADDRAGVSEWLPGGPGHVLITSRAGGWERIATTVLVDVMARTESVALLRTHRPELSPEEADQLAVALADLPLALAQAGGFLAETATRVSDYLALLDAHATAVLGEGATGDYPRPLAAAIGLSAQQLAQLDPIGLAAVRLCAFLAPESVPVHWLLTEGWTEADAAGPLGALAQAATDPVALRRGVGAAVRLGLATSTHDGVRLHRLVQVVIRDQLGAAAEEVRGRARTLLVAAGPGDPEDPATWAAWARVVPHLLAVDPAVGAATDLRALACNAAWYMIERGDADVSARLAADLCRHWTAASGPDDLHVLWATRCLARACREQGRYEEAHRLYRDALRRSRRVLGDDHPQTLRLAHGCAINLRMQGRYEQARQLQEDTLARYRRVLGDDHPHALHSANHLAVDLSALGQFEHARQLHEDTLARYRRVLGDDHPDTLRSANHLAVDLSALGQFEHARQLHEDTLARCRQVFGDDNPHTLKAADSFGITLRKLARLDDAHRLQEDTLVRYRRVLGDDHPHTLRTAHNLSETLYELGQLDRARLLQADVLDRYRRVLGDEHPDTAHSAAHLAKILAASAR